MRVALFVVLALVASLTPAAAQAVVVNPITVEFSASADHAAMALDGQPMVARYEMRVFIEQPLGTVPAFVTDLGKPMPVGGLITITNAIWFSGLTPNTRYIAKVVAIGPSGEGVSLPSNPFGNVPAPTGPTSVVVRR